MAFKSSKHQNVQPVHMVLNGGLNYSQTPSNLQDNEVRRAHNFIYDAQTDSLITRPGTDCLTASALGSPILAGYYYERSVTEAYHVCASGGKLWYLVGDTYTEIGALNDSTTVPSFLTFNTLLLIADGGADIKTWNGAVSGTYTTIPDSPAATALSMIKNRVVCNASDEPDSVYLSGPEDEADWDTVAGNAVGLRAGFGDMLTVNAFGVFGDDLIVSKKGDQAKRIYRINVADATPANWYVEEKSSNNAAKNAQSMVGAWNNVFFVDENGFKSILGVDVYGDLQVDYTGRKINTVFVPTNICDFTNYLPALNSIWFGLGDRVFCYTERFDPQGGNRVPAFTDILFKQDRIRSAYQAGDYIYLCGHNGYLYKLDDTLATDETEPAVTADYVSIIRTKTLVFGGDGILKKLQWYLRPKNGGEAKLYAYKDEETAVALKTVTLTSEGTELYDANGDFSDDAGPPENDITGYLYDEGSYAWVETSRSRVRHPQMAFEIYVTSGRVGVEWVKAEIAMVEGGE